MKKILVIEDTEEIREEIASILEMEAYEVFQAPNGLLGLQVLAEREVDLVMTDMLMPEMNGFQFLEKMKENKNPTPVIVLSAKAEKADIEKGFGLGARDYLVKPCSPEDMISCIENII